MKNSVLYSFSKYSLSDYMAALEADGVGGYDWGIAADQTESCGGRLDQSEVDAHHILTFTCLNSSDYGSYMIGETDGELTCWQC